VAIAILAMAVGAGGMWLADVTDASERGHGGGMPTQTEPQPETQNEMPGMESMDMDTPNTVVPD
jgi:hypothetical protein